MIGIFGETLGLTWMSVLALPPKTMICNSKLAGIGVESGTPLTVTTILWPPVTVESATCEITILSVP